MRRRTLEAGKELTNKVIKSSKKYSIQTKQPLLSAALLLLPQFKVNFDSAYSQVVAETFLEDLLQSLQSKFRKVDQKRYFNSIIQNAQDMEHQLAFMLDPMSQTNKTKALKPYLENEPQTAAVQAYCGGKTVVLDHKVIVTKRIRPSITFQGSKDKDQARDNKTSSKSDIASSFSSKCLIRLSKQQNLDRKRSIEALKLQSSQLNDKHDDLIKQKIFKQNVLSLTTNLFRSKMENLEKTATKFNTNLTTIDEFTYDYDGSALPLKKFGKAYPEKIKILNPTYKVTHKDTLELRKVKTSKYNFLPVFKTEGQESNKMKVQAADVHQLNLGRKASIKENLNDLSFSQNKEELEHVWKRKLQDIIKSKTIKIRQLKQV